MTPDTPQDNDQGANDLRVVILLFDQLPIIDTEALKQEIARVEPQPRASDIDVDLTVNESSGIFGQVGFGDHLIKLIGIAAPYPQLESMLQPAHLRADQKERIAAQKSHILCYYEGKNASGVEMFIALYKLAYGLRKQNLLGVANTITGMCQSVEMLPSIMTGGFLDSFRESPASSLALWLGFIKFFKQDNTVWFATKGSPVFGVPDLAYLGKSLAETDDVLNMFGDIFTYIFQSGARLAPGHTMQVGEDVYLRFKATYEYGDYLGEQTLVIEKIRASDINKPRNG